jgi:hypothetical protein
MYQRPVALTNPLIHRGRLGGAIYCRVHGLIVYCNMLASFSTLVSTVQWRPEREYFYFAVNICVDVRLDSGHDYLSNSSVGEVAAMARRIQCFEEANFIYFGCKIYFSSNYLFNTKLINHEFRSINTDFMDIYINNSGILYKKITDCVWIN